MTSLHDNASELAQLRNGDEAAFARLVRAHHRALLALARPIVGESEAAEVVQIAWIKAHAALKDFEGRSALRTWLSRIVINEARMMLRQRKREVFLEDMQAEAPGPLVDRFRSDGHWSVPPVNWHADSPDSLLTREELADCLAALLDSLPSNQRALLELRDSDGMPFDEVCNMLGVSASNARVLLHRARSRLFALVDHFEETGEC
ncbi:RNA polymerase sigma factor [Alcanivorax sp. 1008]|uniref:RNA polymerase sigma factor n=1 Tax=Alcanivorax sp. 1008 TaxID=2816853 RepID=UPI001D5629CA|nr:sigma-70 family RNA polymerase sigma factor [Alcanivorax sp. 1008]MCC1496348.1 sigma-70 family RNA polymerase sigma factor [Alcanivorax sp. 1008]